MPQKRKKPETAENSASGKGPIESPQLADKGNSAYLVTPDKNTGADFPALLGASLPVVPLHEAGVLEGTSIWSLQAIFGRRQQEQTTQAQDHHKELARQLDARDAELKSAESALEKTQEVIKTTGDDLESLGVRKEEKEASLGAQDQLIGTASAAAGVVKKKVKEVTAASGNAFNKKGCSADPKLLLDVGGDLTHVGKQLEFATRIENQRISDKDSLRKELLDIEEDIAGKEKTLLEAQGTEKVLMTKVEKGQTNVTDAASQLVKWDCAIRLQKYQWDKSKSSETYKIAVDKATTKRLESISSATQKKNVDMAAAQSSYDKAVADLAAKFDGKKAGIVNTHIKAVSEANEVSEKTLALAQAARESQEIKATNELKCAVNAVVSANMSYGLPPEITSMPGVEKTGLLRN